MRPSGRSPLVSLKAQCFDDLANVLHGHAVHGFFRDARSHGAFVAINLPIRVEVQLRVEQVFVHASRQWQSLSASFTNEFQIRVGLLHYATLMSLELELTYPAFPG